MASLSRSRRAGPPRIDDQPIAQQPHITNARHDPMINDIRRANAAGGSKVLVKSRPDDSGSLVLEAYYPVFTRVNPIGMDRRPIGPLPLVFNQLNGETEKDRAQRVFLGMAMARTSTGPGLRGEEAHKIPTVAVQIAGLAPAFANYEPLPAGCLVRVADPYTRDQNGYDVDVYQSPTMSLAGRVHATFRVATKPSFSRPESCGDAELTELIKTVNLFFEKVAAKQQGTSDDVIAWLNILNKHSAPGAFEAKMFASMESASDACVAQYLVDAVGAEYRQSIVGTANSNVLPGELFGLVFGP